MNVLLAEDDLRLGEMLKNLLSQDCTNVDWVTDGTSVYKQTAKTNYDVLILDWIMPRENGLDICRNLRKRGHRLGILILTAKDSIDDRLSGFDAGTDDYLIKPFQYRELWARVRAVYRRSMEELPTNDETTIHVADLSLNLSTRSIYYDDKEIYLTKREFQIVHILALNYGKILSRGEIIDAVWGKDSEIAPVNLDVIIGHLRKKIKLKTPLIFNIRGFGYKMEQINV
ncbi:response regulator transcription factor [Pectinatus frisingensis]|uniref:response regulator transcription factor n=1 Tax=Pectinatus frisingensis TaxID=865 RepID=UPI0018C597A3|nr:response regulator transcription factor [Pectinatus frisingensis]